MATLTITTNDTSTTVLRDPLFEQYTASFEAVETWPDGTVLGRITVGGKYRRVASAATDGSQTPIAVLTSELVGAAIGDVPCTLLISGQVKQNRLTTADGAITAAQVVQLRDYGIIAVDVNNLSIYDNQ